MVMDHTTPGVRNDSLVGWIKTHRWLVVLNIACTLAGGLVIPLLFPEWETWRAVGAGVLGGLGFGYLVTCTRLVGGSHD